MPACTSTALATATVLSSLMFGSAWADEPTAVGATAEAPARLAFAVPVEGLGPALDPASLENYRGGDDSVENDVDIHGQVGGNTAQNTVSGNNTLGGDAFSNASGISTVIQNSGSNVLIQNGMIVNVQFAGSGP